MTRRAFTIIELLVVLLLIGLLVSIGSITLAQARRSGRDARRLNDVLQISQVVEQAASTNGGVYPRNVGASAATPNGQARMCASEIAGAGNPNNLDLTGFPGREIPSDPRPQTAGVTSGCSTYLQGYTYHTSRGNCLSGTVNSLASCQQVTYSLEVGLENPRTPDQTSLRTPDELSISPAYAIPTSNSRFVYILNGRSCGVNCPTQ